MARHVRELGLVFGALALTLAAAIALVAHHRKSEPDPAVTTGPVPSSADPGESSLTQSRQDAINPLETADHPNSERRAEALERAPLNADGAASAGARDVFAIRLDQLHQLQSKFEESSGKNNQTEFEAGHSLLLIAILSRMDVEGRFSPIPPGGERGWKNRPGELHAFGVGRHYVIDLGENPTLAQMQAAVDSVNQEGLPEQKLSRLNKMLVLSEDQRKDIIRVSDLAMEKLTGSH